MTHANASALRALLAEHEVGVTYSSGYSGHAALVAIMNAAPDLLDELDQLREARDELTTAILHTVEYIGTEMLPPIEGWSWYDAMVKHAPDLLQALAIPAKPAGVSRESIEQVRWAEANPDAVALDEVEAARRGAAEGGECGAVNPRKGWVCRDARGHAGSHHTPIDGESYDWQMEGAAS